MLLEVFQQVGVDEADVADAGDGPAVADARQISFKLLHVASDGVSALLWRWWRWLRVWMANVNEDETRNEKEGQQDDRRCGHEGGHRLMLLKGHKCCRRW